MMRGGMTKKGLVCRGKEADKNQHNIAINNTLVMYYEIESFFGHAEEKNYNGHLPSLFKK